MKQQKKREKRSIDKPRAAGDDVFVNKDIVRVEGPYAQKFDQGVVVDTFRSEVPGAWEPGYRSRTTYAKVKMDDDSIKTFRLTSLTLSKYLEKHDE